jgi:hypothetical protein
MMGFDRSFSSFFFRSSYKDLLDVHVSEEGFSIEPFPLLKQRERSVGLPIFEFSVLIPPRRPNQSRHLCLRAIPKLRADL